MKFINTYDVKSLTIIKDKCFDLEMDILRLTMGDLTPCFKCW